MLAGLIIIWALAVTSEGQECNIDIPCPEGFSCHPREDLCYEDPPPVMEGRRHVWLGTGPNRCNRQANDCAVLFDLEHDDVTHKRGNPDDEWCDDGERVRCISKEPSIEPSPPTPANQLQVMAYNIFERAYFISWDGQRERTCRIPEVLLTHWSDVDAITWQEAFMDGCWPDDVSLRDLMTSLGFPYHTETVDRPDLVEPGGIFVSSRWPIIEEDQFVFESSDPNSWDWFAAKGVSYAKIEKSVDGETRIYHVMGTHFQAGGDPQVRVNQSREWADFVAAKNISPDEAVIYSGDLNADWYTRTDHLFEIIGNLQATIPEKVGPMNYTSDPSISDIKNTSSPNGSPSWIDYVLYGHNYLVPITATMEALYPTADEVFPICWCEECINIHAPRYIYPDEPLCDETRYVRHLSDHFPSFGSFVFP